MSKTTLPLIDPVHQHIQYSDRWSRLFFDESLRSLVVVGTSSEWSLLQLELAHEDQYIVYLSVNILTYSDPIFFSLEPPVALDRVVVAPVRWARSYFVDSLYPAMDSNDKSNSWRTSLTAFVVQSIISSEVLLYSLSSQSIHPRFWFVYIEQQNLEHRANIACSPFLFSLSEKSSNGNLLSASSFSFF